MFHYFLKVVSTQYRTLDGQLVNSHQYSVTHFERDLETGSGGNTAEGLQIQHGVNGLPGECSFPVFGEWLSQIARLSLAGVFFSYEISPILVAHRETRQSFAHFLTSYVVLCTHLSCLDWPDTPEQNMCHRGWCAHRGIYP
jgi:hypothetical protein